MRRCTYCMRQTDDGNICRYCGGDESKPFNPKHLPPNTAIGDGYIVGRALNQTEDAIIYAALDQTTQERIRIYEYFPRQLARRDARTLEVAPVLDAIFPGFMSIALLFGYVALIKKGWKPINLILLTMVIGLVGALIHIF